MEKIDFLECEISVEHHNTTAIVNQKSTEKQNLPTKRSTIDDRMSKMKELL